MSDTIITSTITGAQFTDGTTLSGTWTTEYDSSGAIVAITNASFTASGTGGTTTFTNPYVLGYADPSSTGSYEMTFPTSTNQDYSGLYVDWLGENPTSLDEGSPSLYTSIVNDSVNNQPVRLAQSGTVTDTTACFVRGTLIDTTTGPVPIEDLQKGDMILVASGGTRPVKWIGWRHIDIARHADPIAVRPIRITANAIAEGLPRRDLCVSPAHALLIDGKLIPACLLRNGTTINIDFSLDKVTYYHVELDAHDALLAEGLPTESYLDTGNRAAFENAGLPLTLHPEFEECIDNQMRRIAESFAPFVCDPEGGRPIWEALAARAAILGFALPEVETVRESELCIISGGQRYTPISQKDHNYIFVLPALCEEPRLVSRTFVPAALRPWVNDRRQLGVAFRRAVIQSESERIVVAADDPRLTSGWWDWERDLVSVWRWTDGSAVLPSTSGPVIVDILLSGDMAYPITTSEQPDLAIRRCA